MDIGFLVYPRLTPLDLVGPWEVLSRIPDAQSHLIWTRAGPVQAERQMEITATVAFADAPPLEVLVVPGGPGQLSLMKHTLLLDYIRTHAASGSWTCSVRTGALLLAQAGVLKGRRAATHRQARETLAAYGVKVSQERYVIDGRVATAAGVSAALDLSLELARRLAGEAAAAAIRLQIEYEPPPVIAGGSAEKARQAPAGDLRLHSRAFH